MKYSAVIQDAYEDIGFLSKGRQLDGHDTAVALRAIQRILGLWSESGWLVTSVVKQSFSLVVGTNSYTIGTSSADVSNARPTTILDPCFVEDSGGNRYGVKVITRDQYNRIPDVTVSQRPTRLYYLPSAPNGTIYLDSKPASAETLYYDAEEPITEPTKQTTEITLAPSYRQALVAKLRLELATKKGMPVDPYWMQDWREAKAVLTTRAAAHRVTVSPCEMAGAREYNVLADM